MKQRIFGSLFTAMVGALAFTSCSSDVAEDVKTSSASKQLMTFTASYDNNISSRTSLGSDYSVLWSDGDVLSIFDGNDNQDFTIKSGIGSSSAEFEGAAGTAEKYYAVYPYQNGATIEGNVINKVTIPTTQTAIEGTFDPKANVMTAVSNSANNLAFKNVCSYAKITTSIACKKIVFSAGATDKIAGTFSMTIGDNGIVTTADAISGVNTVTLIPSEGTTFPADGTYYIAIKPGTINGLTVDCVGEDKTITNSLATAIDIFTRGSIIDLGNTSGWEEKEPCCPDDNHPHLIDLGLPSGLKWSCRNVGADNPEDFGDYFMWASVTPDYYCDYGVIPYQTVENPPHAYAVKFSKYVGSLTSFNKDSNATDQDALKTTLDPEDDAARVLWGDNWRMPRIAEFQELRDNCFLEWTTDYKETGVMGLIVYKAKSTADKGKAKTTRADTYIPITNYDVTCDAHIFLPAAGTRCRTDEGYRNRCAYWSSDLYSDPVYAQCLQWLDSGTTTLKEYRFQGHSVRPVCSE